MGPIDLEAFLQDRPAIGGKWYAYDPSGHALAPKPEAWVVRDVEAQDGGAGVSYRFAAFRIVSVYEPDRAASGRFTLEVSVHVGDAWSAPRTWLSPRNIKDTGPLCVDLFAAFAGDGSEDVECAGDGWQLRLAMQNRLSTSAGIAVAEPALFARSAAATHQAGSALLARLDDRTSLDGLPDPAALPVLDDNAPQTWDSTDWEFRTLAPDLPMAGMALGPRFVTSGFDARDDVHWLVNGRFEVVRFTVAPVVAGDMDAGLRLSAARVEGDFEDWSVPDTFPSDTLVDVPMPAVGEAEWLSFRSPTLRAEPDDVEGARWPHAPPPAARWDLALVRPNATTAFLVVSPFASILNATARGLDEELPPVAP